MSGHIQLIVFIVTYIVDKILNSITGPSQKIISLINNFFMGLSLSILLLNPVISIVILWTARGASEMRERSWKIFIIHICATLLYVYFKEKSNLSKNKAKEKEYKSSMKNKISKLLEDMLIGKMPHLSLYNSYLSLLDKVYKSEIDEDDSSWYTNEEFEEKASELVKKLDTIIEIKTSEAKIVDQVFKKPDSLERRMDGVFWGQDKNSPISQCKGILKGASGEVKAKEVIESLKINYLESFNLKHKEDDESVEIDFITSLEGCIYAVEVKDYSADLIILENSGQFVRKKGNHTDNLDTLKQISRHNEFIRASLGKSVAIKNIIVLTDKNTIVQDNFDNDNVRVIYVDALPFLINKNQGEVDRELLAELNNNMAPAKKFKFFNIDAILKEVNELMEKEKTLKNKLRTELENENYMETLTSDIEKLVVEELRASKDYRRNKHLSQEILEETRDKALAQYRDLLTGI